MHRKPNYNSAHALDRAAKAHPERTAIAYEKFGYTVAECALRTRQLAQLLAGAGITQGDHVAIISHNSPYHLLLEVACARIGAVMVPISTRLRRADQQALIDFCAPRAIIAEPAVADHGPFESTGGITHFVIDDDPHAPSVSVAIEQGYFALDAAISAHSGQFITTIKTGSTALNSRTYPEGPALLMFTSASSGPPKAVELTHEQLWWAARNFREGFEYANHDVVLTVAPLTHIGGLIGTTLDLFTHGGKVVIVRDFNPELVLEQIERHRVTMMFGVPTIYAALLAEPSFETRARTLRLPLIGGAPVPPELIERMRAAGLAPLNVWGMTETGGAGAYLPAEQLDNRPGSIGRPFAHVEARILDETGADATAGELLVRGPNVVASYWHDDAPTPASDIELVRDGWLRTGDLVRLDDGGFLWVTGRKHNIVNSGGVKIQAEEVQAAVAGYPGVSDCAVIGTPDDRWGEVVSVAVVMQAGFETPTLDQLRAYAEGKLAHFKLPRKLIAVDALPTNANGKADLRALAAMFG